MGDTRRLLQEQLFERAPILAALLDRDLTIVEANERFRRVFPDWSGRRCFELLLGRTTACSACHARKTFEDGRTRVAEVALPIAWPHPATLVTRVAAVPDPDSGNPGYVIWMGSAADEAESLQRENEVLFEHTPCYVAVLDRNLRIVRANGRMREAFGGERGEACYRVYKRRANPCDPCPAMQAFADGQEHTARQVGVVADGREIDCVTTAFPLAVGAVGDDARSTAYVIEISVELNGASRCLAGSYAADVVDALEGGPSAPSRPAKSEPAPTSSVSHSCVTGG